MLNKVMLIGHVGRDAEARYTQGGTPVANFSLATTERWKGDDGKQNEKTEWHQVVVWGKQAEIAAQYVTKGRQVYVEGSLQTREWDDKDGNKRKTTEVKAQRFQLLDKRDDANDRPAAAAASARERVSAAGGQDDIPF